jgi:YebC/PmpR family DNA-binding regulatory protein
MSGHSKWATIKRKKAKTDVARAKAWNKLIKEISVAAKLGGGDPETNPRLRAAILKAKGQSLPNKNIESSIAKGVGGNDGTNVDELTYECYGPNGTAFLVQVMTDNKTRTVAEVRNAFNKNGGNMGEPGSVAWGFKNQGVILIETNAIEEDELMELVIEAGADDMTSEEGVYEINTPPDAFLAVTRAIENRNIEMMSAELTYSPENTVKLEGADIEKLQKLVDKLEDLEDVQEVYHNAEYTDPDEE